MIASNRYYAFHCMTHALCAVILAKLYSTSSFSHGFFISVAAFDIVHGYYVLVWSKSEHTLTWLGTLSTLLCTVGVCLLLWFTTLERLCVT